VSSQPGAVFSASATAVGPDVVTVPVNAVGFCLR
jgi:hypothetical protein